eukprot:Gb_04554 [translate_table: standard]
MRSSKKDVVATKHSMLNPNAAEFVPFALRAASTSTNHSVVGKSKSAERSGVAVTVWNGSTNSSTSHDQSQQFWLSQLPDDITLDKSAENNGLTVVVSNGAANLSTSDECWQSQLPDDIIPDFGMVENDDIISRGSHALDYANPFKSVANDRESPADDSIADPVEYLAMAFPGFATDSLAGIYDANAGDLDLTIDMLMQLELQDDASPHCSTQSASALMDFPSFSCTDTLLQYTGDEAQQAVNMHGTLEADSSIFSRHIVSGDSRNVTDFPAVVRKRASQQSDQWNYETNGAMDSSLGTSSNSQVPANFFPLERRVASGNRTYTTTRQIPQLPPQARLDTGEAVASFYSNLREEAQDHARVRNAYFDQARQAYLVGNKSLSKEWSDKAQWHNGQMKTAHDRAGEAICHQRSGFKQFLKTVCRNLATAPLQNYALGQERFIDLHAFPVNEAIHVLKHELTVLQNIARSTQQQQQLVIFVGTGHQTTGSHAPAGLPLVVGRFLMEVEHLDYSETQPGMLQIVIN